MAGNLIQGWGGPGQGYEWPDNLHGMFVDYKDNVWIGGNGMNDTNILKFHAEWKVPASDRPSRKDRRKQQYGNPPPAGGDHGVSEDE